MARYIFPWHRQDGHPSRYSVSRGGRQETFKAHGGPRANSTHGTFQFRSHSVIHRNLVHRNGTSAMNKWLRSVWDTLILFITLWGETTRPSRYWVIITVWPAVTEDKKITGTTVSRTSTLRVQLELHVLLPKQVCRDSCTCLIWTLRMIQSPSSTGRRQRVKNLSKKLSPMLLLSDLAACLGTKIGSWPTWLVCFVS